MYEFYRKGRKERKGERDKFGEWSVTFSIHCRRKEDPPIASIGATCDTVSCEIDDQSSFASFAVKYLNE